MGDRLRAARPASVRQDLILRGRAAWFVFLAALAFFAAGAATRGLWTSDEHRIAEVVREMTAPGGSWLVPHLEGAVYAHKPPLVPWVGAFAQTALHLDLATAVKVPSVLGAALAVLGTFLIGRRLWGAPAGLAAAAILATLGEFDWICRRAQYDPLLAGFTTLALWFFVRSHFPDEEGADPPAPWRDAILGSLCVGFAGFAKGPAALAFTAPVILAFAAAAREWRIFRTPRLAALVFVLVPALLWIVPAGMRAGGSYVKDLVLGHGVAHAAGDLEKIEPFWFYGLALPKGLLPWTLLVPAGCLALTKWRDAAQRRADLFVMAWCLAPLVVMSLSPAKRDLYLVPMYPAVALLIGKLAALGEERLRSGWFSIPAKALAAAALAGGLVAVAVAAMLVTGLDGPIERALPMWTSVRAAAHWVDCALAAVFGLLTARHAVRALRGATTLQSFADLRLAVLSAFAIVVAGAVPVLDALQSPRSFYEQAAKIVGDAPLGRYGLDDYSANWAMPRTSIPYFEPPGAAGRFLAAQTGPAFLVAEQDYVDRHGTPPDARVVLRGSLPLGKDLLLFTKAP